MNKTLLIVVILIIVLAAGGYFYSNRETSSITPVQTPTQITQALEPSTSDGPSSNAELLAGGNSFLDKNGIYSLLYPSDYLQDMEGDTIARFYKRGPSEREQSEMTDGVIITVQTEPLNGKTLEQKVDEAIKQSTTGGMAEVTSPKAPITVNNQNGFTYKIRGLGESTYVVLQKNDNPQYAVTVVYSVLGEQQQTYQQQVNSMVSTIQILK